MDPRSGVAACVRIMSLQLAETSIDVGPALYVRCSHSHTIYNNGTSPGCKQTAIGTTQHPACAPQNCQRLHS